MGSFSVAADVQEKEVDRDPSDNFIEDVVEHSRSNQVLNEEQTVITALIYATGLLPDWRDYAGGVITGGSAGGKTHMKQNVVDDMFAYVPDWLYNPTGFSPKAVIDDPKWDEAKIGALNELQKVPDEVLEFLKSAHGDDGGFDYRRDVADGDSPTGYEAKAIKREPKPVVFMLADENAYEVEQELVTRLIEIKVDENEEKNEAVHLMKWGHDHITLPSSDREYVWDDEDLEHVVRAHLRDADDGLADVEQVVIPTGDDRFEGDDWNAGDVVGPMFNFGRSQSTRASSMIASLVKASAALNYHSRERVTVDGETALVVEPQDVGNVMACRSTLLATTHGLTDKKFAILDAIMEKGGQANAQGTALQATKKDVVDYVQDNPDIATMTKTEIKGLLDQLDEDLILNKKDHPEDNRKNIYVYDGGATFKKPRVYDYYDYFADVVDPIKNQPIEQSLDEQLDELNAQMQMESVASAEATQTDSESLASFEDGGDAELTEVESAVSGRLSETLDGRWVPARVVESNDLKVAHMVGVSPVEEQASENANGDSVTMVVPGREPNGGDFADGFMSHGNDLWETDSIEDVKSQVSAAVGSLKEKGVLVMEKDDVGNVSVSVEA